MEKSKEVESNSEEIKKYELILNHCQDDYKMQLENKKTLETKTSYMLVLVSFLFGLLLNLVLTTDLNTGWNEIGVASLVLRIIFSAVYVGTIALCVISIFMYILVIITRKYGKVRSEFFETTKLRNTDYIDVLKTLINSYKTCIEHNLKITEKASSKYKVATILALISTILTVVCYAMAYFFV